MNVSENSKSVFIGGGDKNAGVSSCQSGERYEIDSE